jgi:hypothetical protein
MKLKLAILSLFASAFCYGQTQTKISPDCSLGNLSFSGVSNSIGFDNRPQSSQTGIPCSLWSLVWSAEASVTSLTIEIQGAPDANGVPGSYSSIASGSTFASGKANFSSSTSYYPWMRVSVTAVGGSGNITAILNGWRDNASSISGGGGGGGGPPTGPAGGTLCGDYPDPCLESVPIGVELLDSDDFAVLFVDAMGNLGQDPNFAYDPSTGLDIIAGSVTVVPVTLERASGQTADMLDLLDSDGLTVLGRFDANADLLMPSGYALIGSNDSAALAGFNAFEGDEIKAALIGAADSSSGGSLLQYGNTGFGGPYTYYATSGGSFSAPTDSTNGDEAGQFYPVFYYNGSWVSGQTRYAFVIPDVTNPDSLFAALSGHWQFETASADQALATDSNNYVISLPFHGDGSDVQLSDGTGAPGDVAIFDSDGNVTDGGTAYAQTIASGAASLGTGAISSGACASAVTVSATGVASTDTISTTFAADPTSTTGYEPSTNGMLTIIPYPTANNVNFKVCNNTLAPVTPGAITLNFNVFRGV